VYTSPDDIGVIKPRRVRLTGLVARMRAMRNSYKIFVGRPDGNREFGRPRYRWKGNIRIYLRELGWEGVDWIHLAQDMDSWWAVITAINLRGIS
jgi:hypothetical protein